MFSVYNVQANMKVFYFKERLLFKLALSLFFFFFQSYFTDVDRNLQTDSSSVKLFKADTFSIIFDLHNILASFASFEGMLTRKFRLALLFLLGRCRLCTGNMKSQVVEGATNI